MDNWQAGRFESRLGLNKYRRKVSSATEALQSKPNSPVELKPPQIREEPFEPLQVSSAEANAYNYMNLPT